jgi:peroxiredoxin
MVEIVETIKVGDTAPEFALSDQHKEEHRLSDMRGKRVLLSFHPLAWTGICAQQMKSLEANMDRFEELDTVPLGVSVDSVPCKLAWGESLGIEHLRMLSDFWPHGGYAKELGLFMDDKGITRRANVILDEDGKVAWVKVYEISELPDIEEVLDHLGELGRERR